MKKFLLSLLILFIAISSVFLGNKLKDSTEVMIQSTNNDNIKWVEFNIPKSALDEALELDIGTHETERHLPMYESLAYVAAKNYGDFSKYKKGYLTSIGKDIPELIEKLENRKLFNYYLEAYSAAIGGLVGSYTKVDSDGSTETGYGLRAFSPIASSYYYYDYDDFGAARSYGYKRSHLGHDIMGSIGTPIIAVESGRVEAVGWNQYGGWRVGIRSFDGMRYYYYAHLRKDHPYCDLYEGKIVNAGQVIGYLGMTGYSPKENTNNIDIPHLHFGLELIFSPEQKDGYNQIWIDVYALTQFLYKNRSETSYDPNTKEHIEKYSYIYSETPD